MSMSEEICYTLITISNNSEPPNELQLKFDLENGDIQVKIETLKKLIHLILSGEKFPSLLMTVIRYVLPLQDHIIKKLLLIFWEIVPKTTPDGNLDEMILVCEAYRKDLLHPNEFIRGSTLRFLCKLKEPDLLEPLMSVIRGCLKHHHSYVRRNAVLTILTIYKNFDFLIPDAPELVANFLEVEQDQSCKRNAVLMLICENQEHALKYLCSCIDQVHSFDNTLQLVIVELIYKVCHNNPSENSRFIACIYNLLNSNSSAVCYAAARTLFTLSSSSDAVKASAGCYIKLIMDESDNTVKMIVLDQLIAMREIPAHEKVLRDLVMDILRVLTASDVEVRRKTLNLALDLISSTNVKDMVLALKKEIIKTQRSTEYEGFGKYCQLLVQTLHSCCIRFPDTASIVIPVLLDFLCDNNEQVAADVLIFVREAIQKFNQLRNMILSKLIDVFSSIKVSTIYRSALWILGEYCCSPEDIQCVMTAIRQSLGTIPIVDDEMKVVIGGRKESDPAMSSSVQKLMNTGGACVTQSFFKPKALKVEQMSLRGYLMKGDYFIAAALSSSLTKLALKYMACVADPKKQNAFIAESMIIMISVVHLGKSGLATNDISDDDFERISLCLKVLANRSPIMISIFNQQCRKSLAGMLAAKPNEKTYNIKAKEEKYITTFAADSIAFDLLARKDDTTGIENIFELSLSQAMGTLKKEPVTDFSSLKFNKVTQLTGYSDPVYAEAYVHVNQCDIILDVLIINQTLDTLQNCSLELATLGDLKLVDKPAPVILGPQDFCNIKTSVKVAWTENGIIFGNIVYDICAATGDQSVVILNDIHVNIMDYIVPAVCTEQEFQEMWSEFKWENKMSINTNLVDMNAYLMHITSLTNTRCLTHGTALSGKCDFMAANLYAQSTFGEHALVNVSIEKNPRNPDDPVTGHIRIRAKTRGMVLGLGNKISLSLMSGG